MKPITSRSFADYVLLGLAVAAVLAKFAVTTADPDLWGHLRFGADILASGHIARSDPYSYLTTPGTWVNHEWLAEVAYAAAYAAGGARGLVLLKLMLTLVVSGLMLSCLLLRGLQAFSVAVTLLLMAPALGTQLGTVRPQLFTLVCFAVTLFTLSLYEQGRRWALWTLPPLFVLWANCHGGFLAGMSALVLWWAARSAQRIWSAFRSRSPVDPAWIGETAAVAVSVGATAVNPYGLELWRFLLATATVPRPEITEWGVLEIRSIEGASHLTLVIVGMIALLSGRRSLSLPWGALLLVFAAAPLVAMRHLSLFALLWAAVVGEHLDGMWTRLAPRGGGGSGWGDGRLSVSLAAAGIVLLGAVTVPKLAQIVVPAGEYPVRAVAWLKRSEVVGNLAVDFDWGEYAIWHLNPRIKVSVDGRRETVYGREVYEQNLAFMSGTGRWDALLDDHDTPLALVRRGPGADERLRSKPGWRLAYQDEVSALFVREGSAASAPLRQIPPPPPLAPRGMLVFP